MENVTQLYDSCMRISSQNVGGDISKKLLSNIYLSDLMALYFLVGVQELATHQGGEKEGVHSQGHHLGISRGLIPFFFFPFYSFFALQFYEAI